jgi:hypothetical protein
MALLSLTMAIKVAIKCQKKNLISFFFNYSDLGLCMHDIIINISTAYMYVFDIFIILSNTQNFDAEMWTTKFPGKTWRGAKTLDQDLHEKHVFQQGMKLPPLEKVNGELTMPLPANVWSSRPIPLVRSWACMHTSIENLEFVIQETSA